MKEEIGDEELHTRLMMLSEFDGEIEGRLKFHKSLYQYRNSKSDSDDWSFRREEHGPLDPGFSSRMQSYEDLEMADVDEDREPHRFRITGKGERFVQGLSKGLSKLKDGFDEKQNAMRNVASRNKGRTGSEIEKDEDVQRAKEEPYQTDV
ncbi:hypothetical protein GL213_03490 [Halogeometricum borinquense]|uniref:Uncharacterized protein n=1 Tax=Halogeometricum borinquense (strain ATCC 700274 / DSM 11551 / JCM 10706 / KCTC 4070 / PR3) TaxID=469382 RepID=E4NN68_HALBP|nr:hypothetical protein [Halogeometricum borinquense]ADQ66298.1 hypothetical protein Hbor_07000 [Halogeometricum borinquense DSM 11551]ELY27713.1 hypothetical protein C499_09087 [Halogeometricum borinquense DSM 11551]QIQ75671.1 hypothetical protein GL213_03490 [Halogeometricum borinquense]